MKQKTLDNFVKKRSKKDIVSNYYESTNESKNAMHVEMNGVFPIFHSVDKNSSTNTKKISNYMETHKRLMQELHTSTNISQTHKPEEPEIVKGE